MANLSTLDLVGYQTRLRAFLVNADKVSYADEALSEALRQASGDLGRVYGAFVTIKDLDSAASTNVEKADEDLLIRGAAGFAARMRAVDRADSANIGQSMPGDLLEWSKNTLFYFDDKLKSVKTRRLQQSTSNPASPWTWDETNKNW